MILIRFSELAGLMRLPLRVIADLIRNSLPTTHIQRRLRALPAMTIGWFLYCFTTFAMTGKNYNLGNLFNLVGIVVQTNRKS